jgi:hypothetical protein
MNRPTVTHATAPAPAELVFDPPRCSGPWCNAVLAALALPFPAAIRRGWTRKIALICNGQAYPVTVPERCTVAEAARLLRARYQAQTLAALMPPGRVLPSLPMR